MEEAPLPLWARVRAPVIASGVVGENAIRTAQLAPTARVEQSLFCSKLEEPPAIAMLENTSGA